MSNTQPFVILMADDDPDDRMLSKEALDEICIAKDLRFVKDGEELLDYLKRRGKYASPGSSPHPSVLLLDLNMPRKDGREALREIKIDPDLRHIPIMVLTTSKAEEDISGSYDLGVSSYIAKPVTFTGLVEMMQTISKYWFELVELPPAGRRN
jgi:CheY-like chemotaxis protein